MVFSAVKNRQIDWAKLIYDDLLNKLRLPQSSKAPQRHTTVMYPHFLSGVIKLRYSDADTYPDSDLHYSEIGNTMLNNKRQSITDVRLRNVIHPALILSLADPSAVQQRHMLLKKPGSLLNTKPRQLLHAELRLSVLLTLKLPTKLP